MANKVISMDAVTKMCEIQWDNEVAAEEKGLPNLVTVHALTPNCLELLEECRKRVDEQIRQQQGQGQLQGQIDSPAKKRQRKTAPDLNSIELLDRGEKLKANERLKFAYTCPVCTARVMYKFEYLNSLAHCASYNGRCELVNYVF